MFLVAVLDLNIAPLSEIIYLAPLSKDYTTRDLSSLTCMGECLYSHFIYLHRIILKKSDYFIAVDESLKTNIFIIKQIKGVAALEYELRSADMVFKESHLYFFLFESI